MSGFNPSAAPGPEQRENQRVLADRLDELYYAKDAGAGEGAVLGTAAFVYRAAGTFTYVLLPNGATTAWAFPVRVRKDWRRVGVRWTIWYTSPVGSTAVFALIFAANPYGAAGDNLTTLADLFATAAAPAGPAVAETVLSHTFVQTASLLGSYRPWASFRIVRSDPDANANDLWILSTRIEVLPQ